VSKAPADTLRLLELDLFATEDFVDGYVQIGPVLNAAIPDSMSITLCGAELCAVGRSFLVRLTNYVEESAQGGVQASFEPSSYSSDYGILYVSGNRIAPPYRFYVGWEQATVNGIAMPIRAVKRLWLPNGASINPTVNTSTGALRAMRFFRN
jgi:hypothetical protein